MADFRSCIGLHGATASNRLRAGAFQADEFGRRFPFDTTTDVAVPWVLGQVEADVFASDDADAAYPGGQLWTRVVSSFDIDGSASNDDWIAVPAALPAGFTVRNRRNTHAPAGVTTTAIMNFRSVMSVDWWESAAPIYQTFVPSSSDHFVRTASGVYLPMDTLGAFAHGPINRNTQVHSFASNNTNSGSPAGTLPPEVLIVKSPGFRNIRIIHHVAKDFYDATDPDFFLTTSYNGNVQTTPKAAFLLDAIPSPPFGNRYTKTYNIGPFLAAHGSRMNFTYAEAFGGHFLGGVTITPGSYEGLGAVSSWSPRIDIPMPWTATSGNLVAPGGILTGTIPGY